MTIGQRITEKRKEAALTQEQLGQQLGVSRQSVYKWESDGALPEIDKLIAMSRLFGVTVGWLLGVEEPAAQTGENPEEGAAGDGRPAADPEQQARLAEEIARKYLEAQKPSKKARRWRIILACAAAVAIIWGGTALMHRLNDLENQYNRVQNGVNIVQNDLRHQIDSITGQVREALKEQNRITADFSVTRGTIDIPKGTVEIAVMALPRTQRADTQAKFLVDYGSGEPMIYEGQRQSDGSFRADLLCRLEDRIQVSVAFVTDGEETQQRLETFYSLYSDTFPEVDLRGHSLLMWHEMKGRTVPFFPGDDVLWYELEDSPWGIPVAQAREVKIGLFKNKELVTWLEPCEKPDNWMVEGGETKNRRYARMPRMDVAMEPGDVLSMGALVVDEYGRENFQPDYMSYTMQPDPRKHPAGQEAWQLEITGDSGLPQNWKELEWKYK